MRCLWKVIYIVNLSEVDDEVEFIKKMVKVVYGVDVIMNVEVVW